MLEIESPFPRFILLTIMVSGLMGLHLMPGFAEEAGRPSISARQFAIAGVTLGANKVDELFKAFGEPVEVRAQETEDGPDTARTYIFKGVEAYVQGSELLNLECTSPKYSTPGGARVGDTLETVFRIYGKAEVGERVDHQLIGYDVGNTDAILLIYMRDGHVFKIELWLNYT